MLGSVLLGVAIGAFYDLFRITRLVLFRGSIAVFIEDVLFWTVSGYAVFLHILALNKGEVRAYILACVLAGFLFYYFTIGRAVFSVLKRASERIRFRIARLSLRIKRISGAAVLRAKNAALRLRRNADGPVRKKEKIINEDENDIRKRKSKIFKKRHKNT